MSGPERNLSDVGWPTCCEEASTRKPSFERDNRGDKVRTTEPSAKSAPVGMRARGLMMGVVPLLCVLVGVLGFASAPALAAGEAGETVCPNAASRIGPSASLPDCRAYELVSPVFKGGYGVLGIEGVAQNGESVAYYSPGAFAGAPAGISEALDSVTYLARRDPTGWSTVPLMPPEALSNELVGAADLSPTLGTEIEQIRLPNLEDAAQEPNRVEYGIHSTEAPDVSSAWEPLGGILLETLTKEPLIPGYVGASADFCHVVFENGESYGFGALLPAAKGVDTPLYELDRGCGGEPAGLRLVAVNNEGEGKALSPSCLPELGTGPGYSRAPTSFNAIAAGGSELFFTTCIGTSGEGNRHQLFVRLAGTHTLEVSKPVGECTKLPCAGASERGSGDFAGANETGTVVFFTAPLAAGQSPLVPGDVDRSENLYMASIGCREGKPGCGVAERTVTSLLQASHDPIAGQAAEVQGVVRVAPDGSRVYFLARGVLSEGRNALGLEPVRGADNLYVYEHDERYPAGHVAFVADLCSGPSLSGTTEDTSCPSKAGSDTYLWAENEPEAQTAGGDGRYLVFSTYAQLVAGDTDAAKDVYRYDAQSGTLDRVSGGEGGYHANGNDSAFDATIIGHGNGAPVKFQYELNSRAISEDGSRIVFTTSEPLSPRAINGLPDVYEWHEESGEAEGHVSLLSSGSAETQDGRAVITPGGRDVFFTTTQALVAQDVDGGAPDVYDARIDGGFSEPPASRQPCAGDACQGPLTNPAPLLVPGSVPQAPGGNFTVTTPKKVPKVKKSATKKRRGKKKSKAKRGRASRRSHGSVAAGRSGQ